METSFLKKFQPENQEHVQWLMALCQFAENLNTTDDITQLNPMTVLQSNPMRLPVSKKSLLEFPIIHLGISGKYTQAVFKGTAWIPAPPSESGPSGGRCSPFGSIV
jgi:hypothetical protein